MDMIKAVHLFKFDGNPVSCQAFGSGHIDSTYKIFTDTGKTYVLQHINKYIYESPLKVMENTGAVTNYLTEHTDGKCQVMHFMTTHSGRYCHHDEQDLSKVKLDLHLFEVYAKGYLEAVPSLTENEIKMLPMGALTMTLEVAVRFLKDYLDGDLYLKSKRPDHNLIRARNQIALATDMEKKLPEMERIIAKLRSK